jgi:hypothetical protein
LVFGHHNIIDHGAITNLTDTETAIANADAFLKAVSAANSSLTDKEVYVPEGDFYFFPALVTFVNNLTLTIDGRILASSDYENWPNSSSSQYIHFLYI